MPAFAPETQMVSKMKLRLQTIIRNIISYTFRIRKHDKQRKNSLCNWYFVHP